MASEPNIRLDIDEIGAARAREEVSRLIVAVACGYTRDGSAATITADCTNIRTLQSEAKRLKAEIDIAVEDARAHYSGKNTAGKDAGEKHASGVVKGAVKEVGLGDTGYERSLTSYPAKQVCRPTSLPSILERTLRRPPN